MISFKILFTPGRSGTAFLAQVFGFGDHSKRAMHFRDGNLITHENLSSKELPIPYLKQHGVDTEAGLKLATTFILGYLDSVQRDFPGVRRHLMTDHRIGRYFAWAMSRSGLDYQVVFVRRRRDDLARSFLRRLEKERARLDPDTFERYCRNNWTKSFYHPSDHSAIGRMSGAEWNSLDDLGKFLWYAEEVEAQAQRLKGQLPPERALEVDYEKLKRGDLERLSAFLGMPYERERVDVFVNRDHS